jgi:hypothetical protein
MVEKFGSGMFGCLEFEDFHSRTESREHDLLEVFGDETEWVYV